jgi:hypothetical protein
MISLLHCVVSSAVIMSDDLDYAISSAEEAQHHTTIPDLK